ncbi:MAG: hypothetical protein ABI862_13430 [Ilumatobacteraceae bacterium]
MNESATTTTTALFCDNAATLPIAVAANASRVNDAATWWTNSLGVYVPDVHFADPVSDQGCDHDVCRLSR